jgi:hypothetical protein
MEPILFRETQYLIWWALLILVGTGIVLPVLFLVLAVAGAARSRVAGCILIVAAVFTLLLSAGIFIGYGVMTTEVTAGRVRVSFGWWPTHTDEIPTKEIQSVEVVRYNPGDYGGWGIRARSPEDRVLSQSGDEGVALHLDGRRRLIVGSQEAEALAAALRPLLRPGPR